MPVNVMPANIPPRLEKPSMHRDGIKYREKDGYPHRLQYLIRAVYLEKDYLGHNGTKFPAGSSESMRSRAISRGKDLPGDDERRHVRPKVGEEVCQTVQRNKRLGFGPLVEVRLRPRIDPGYQKHLNNEVCGSLLMDGCLT
jgi:hypothetical protein